MIEDFAKITNMLQELVESMGRQIEALEKLPQTDEVKSKIEELQAGIAEIMGSF